MLVGALLNNYIVLTGEASVMMTSYAPMEAHPLFYVSLILFAVGALISLLEPLLDPRRRSSRDVTDAAARLGAPKGLGVLEILDGTGAILSSMHWRERAGKPAPDALRFPEGAPVSTQGD